MLELLELVVARLTTQGIFCLTNADYIQWSAKVTASFQMTFWQESIDTPTLKQNQIYEFSIRKIYSWWIRKESTVSAVEKE